MNPRPACPAVALLLGLFMSCREDVASIPCQSGADCPQGYLCDLTRNRCFLEPPAEDGGQGEDTGSDVLDGGEQGEDGPRPCDEPLENQKYCVNPDYCYHNRPDCRDGEWICLNSDEVILPPDEFDDWAWRCGLYHCYAWDIPDAPGEDWREPQPYVPPDPDEFKGVWTLVADSDDIMAPGCERQPLQYADVQAIAVDPGNPDVIYVGLVADESPPWWVSGVYKSVDGGTSWFEARARLGSGGCYDGECRSGTTVYRLYMDPDDSQVLFASTLHRGLYRTSNGAATWEQVELPAYCGWVGPVGKGGNGRYYVGCKGVLLFSDDGGYTFYEGPYFGTVPRYITALGFDPRLPERVWAGVGEASSEFPGEGYIFLSDDGGLTWMELGREIDDVCQGRGAVRDINICPANPDQMTASVYYCGLFISEDGGATWHEAGSPMSGFLSLTAEYYPDPIYCRLYASRGSDAPLMWSTDAGQNWNDEFRKPLEHIFFNPFLPGRMLGILIHQSIYPGDRSFELWEKQ